MPNLTDVNVRGVVFMVLAMAAFALADALVKLSAAFLTPAQVVFLLIAGGLVLFSLLAVLLGEPLRDRRMFAPMLLLRYFSEIVGMIGMVMALINAPLSTVGAVTQATPLLVAAGAVFFFGETVGWRRWSAILLGFFGVLLVIQPSAEGFDAAILWAVLSLVGLSVRDLTTRLTPVGMSTTSLAAFTMLAATPFAAAWVLLTGQPLIPADANWLIILPMISLGSVGYLLLTMSIRTAEVSVVAPFRFSRILFLLALGVLIFDERPNLMMLTGAVLIIVSGVYLLLRKPEAAITTPAE